MKIIMIGQGGHSNVVRDLIEATSCKYEVIGQLDDKYEELMLKETMYYGPISSVSELFSKFETVRLIVAIGNNKVRKQLVDKIGLPNEYYLTLVHPSAMISSSAEIGHGTVVMPYSVINANTKIGHHAIINTSAIIEHDNKLDDFVHISPNATLTGGIKIGEGVHIGSGANLIPNVEVGQWSVIGAGAAVIRSIPSYSTAVGVPARTVHKKVIEGA